MEEEYTANESIYGQSCSKRWLVDYSNGREERIIIMQRKKCYGKCNRCVWKSNGGCSEWRKSENN